MSFRLPRWSKRKPSRAAHADCPTLTTISIDLLISIAEGLDDRTILILSKVCRTLHHIVLPVFFKRHCPSLLASKELALARSYSSLVLPAIYSAIFVKEIRTISISLHAPPARLVHDLTLLKIIFYRGLVPESLTLDLGNDASGWPEKLDFKKSKQYHVCKQIPDALKDVLDVALHRCCKSLALLDGHFIQSVLDRSFRGRIPTPVKPRLVLSDRALDPPVATSNWRQFRLGKGEPMMSQFCIYHSYPKDADGPVA